MAEPRKWRKKPVEVEAIRFDGTNQREIAAWMGIVNFDPNARLIHIATLEGVMTAQPGDWIVRGVKGELYPCKADIFEATYEEVTRPRVVIFGTSCCGGNGVEASCEVCRG